MSAGLQRLGWRVVLIASGISLTGLAITVALMVLRPIDVPSFDSVRSAYLPSDAYLLDRNGAVIDSVRIQFDVRRFPWVPLADVSPALVGAVIDGEDRGFWEHHGVYWPSVLGAVRDQLFRNRQRGASTITMQLASLLDHSAPTAGTIGVWKTKLFQTRVALSIEKEWRKRQILEAYLNLLSYRGELQGIGAAAQLLAGKTPSSLSLPESLVLAALLPRPSADRDIVVARACARAQASGFAVSCDLIHETAGALLGSVLTSETWKDRLAPQLAHQLLNAPGQHLRTTLDTATQRLARDTLRTHLEALSSRNVRDGAVLVADNETGEVLAYVGSAGPFSRAESVDGVRARRQAGSTLKPFLYELAFEKRYLTAASLLEDSPLHLDTATGAYIPQDYDRDFKGLVSVRTALANSLNIPAVRTLVLVGVETFANRLRKLGYSGITENGDYYGYSLALGSAEVTLWEQAQAYRALARDGRWSPLILEPNQAAADKPILPPDASFIVANIMSDRAARTITFGFESHLNTPFWSAVKTGTSKDMRDNWCIGFSREFTVAVWVGNFEGDAMHDVSGVTGAAPVWHDLMLALHQDVASTSPTPPSGVSSASIRFSANIEPERREWFLNGTSSAPIVSTPSRGMSAKIESPANGMVIAIDPDIPDNYQRVTISVAGAGEGMQLKLNDRSLGSAEQHHLWTPTPGSYGLTLEDRYGHVIDRILFTVRAATTM